MRLFVDVNRVRYLIDTSLIANGECKPSMAGINESMRWILSDKITLNYCNHVICGRVS